MLARRIGYLVLLVLGFYFTMLYNFQGLRFLMCCAVCLPLACLLPVVPGAFLCRVRIGMGQLSVARGEPVKIRILAEKRGVLPAAGVLVTLRWQAPGEKERKIKKWIRGIRCGQEEVTLELAAPHCGRARLVAARAVLCDYFGIFSLPVRVGGRMECCIMPRRRETAPKRMDLDGLRALLWDGEREGDLFLRDFRPGDSIHRVYWKLSSKPGELQVRDQEQSGSVKVFLNESPGFRERAGEWDRFLEQVYSVLYFLADALQTAGMSLEVLWRQGTALRGYEIHGPEAMEAWLYGMLMREDAGRPLAEEELPPLRDGCHFEEDGRMYLGEQCVYE